VAGSTLSPSHTTRSYWRRCRTTRRSRSGTRLQARCSRRSRGTLSPSRATRSCWRRHRTTRRSRSGFIQFAVEGLRRVYPIPGSPDCTICAHAEKKDGLVTARKYEPHLNAVALTHPPIRPDLFFHLWECRAHITPTVQNMWLNRLPKEGR
jgi:hypothetical protein